MTLDPRMFRNPAADALADPPVLVRTPKEDERSLARSARTGDRLPGGAVVLRQEDMDRMGLDGLRRWILRHAGTDRAIVIAPRPTASPHDDLA